jgi:predicted MFS family arabinose efflux permease
VVFLIASLQTRKLMERLPRRPVIAVSAIGMGLMLLPLLNFTPSVAFTLGCFIPMATFAAFRSTGSSALGLAQLPDRSGSMMAARTASAQLGYMIGAAFGGAVLAIADFGTLAFVLLVGMALSALLVLRVDDPDSEATTIRETLAELVPD